ncbi:MAG: arginine--tRNA ligase [Parcubacteria group bacterium]|nr:arginine--tRNA ligase [Parcubacteria group bacterium]
MTHLERWVPYDYGMTSKNMSVLDATHKELAQLFKKAGIKISPDQFSTPPNQDMGDIAFPCFVVAKEQKKSAGVVAKELYEKLKPLVGDSSSISGVSVSGPYINFTVEKAILAETVFKAVEKEGKKFGTTKNEKQKIIFEYSQPNTHKAFHIGHMRNAMLGAALINLYKSQGNKVAGVTYVNDVGTHVAKCLWALEKFFAGRIPEDEKGRFLGNVYAHAAKMLEEHPEWKEQTQEVLRNLESHEKETEKLWKETRQWSLDGFDKIYNELGIEFDESYYESDVAQNGQKTVDDLLKKGIAKESQDVIIMDLSEYKLDVLVIRKSDGTGLYSTSDLGLAQAKAKQKWDESVVMTDMRQDLYFKQLHKTLELYGFDKPMRHIGYELVRLTTGSMSSRKGSVILYEDFRDEVVEHATKETKERHADWSQEKIDQTAHAIAIASIKFSMLKVKPSQIITFDKEEALSFTGFSAPYILYTNARIASILKKVTSTKGDVIPVQTGIHKDKKKDKKREYDFNHPTEKKLILMLAQYEEILAKAREDEDPSDMCRFTHDMAREFSSFYEQCPVKDADESTKSGRIALITAISQVMGNALGILGIQTLNEM